VSSDEYETDLLHLTESLIARRELRVSLPGSFSLDDPRLFDSETSRRAGTLRLPTALRALLLVEHGGALPTLRHRGQWFRPTAGPPRAELSGALRESTCRLGDASQPNCCHQRQTGRSCLLLCCRRRTARRLFVTANLRWPRGQPPLCSNRQLDGLCPRLDHRWGPYRVTVRLGEEVL